MFEQNIYLVLLYRISSSQPSPDLRNTMTVSRGNHRDRGRAGGVYSACAWPKSYDHRPSHPYYVGTELVGFPPTRQTLLAPRAKRREVFGESHEE